MSVDTGARAARQQAAQNKFSGKLRQSYIVRVSFNKVTSMNGLAAVSSTLLELYLSKNEIGKIEEIEHLVKLRVLELGSNKIRV